MKYLLACLLPPVAVYFSGGSMLTILGNVILTFFGFFPGVLHAAYIVSKHHRGQQEVWAMRHLHGANDEPLPARWPGIIAFPLALLVATPVWVFAWALWSQIQD